MVSGSGALIEDDVDSYEYWYADSTGTQHSQKYQIILDRRCKINDFEVAFLDRRGTISSFGFQLRERLNGTVKKETYNQHIEGSVTALEWGYEAQAQGHKVVNPRVDEIYELNTNYMNENESNYFAELVSSPFTAIKIDDVYYSCIVQDTGYEKQHAKNTTLIRKTVRVKLSVQDVVNG